MTRTIGMLFGAVVLLAIGFATGYVVAKPHWLAAWVKPSPIVEQLPEPHQEKVNLAERELWAVLYVQRAAEYRALCLQTYRYAYECLLARLKEAKGDLPPAVVMDLDETVFDNSRYQSWTYRNSTTYEKETWKEWEQEANAPEVKAVPGAVEFIQKVEKLDPPVKVVFISNRRNKEGALKILEQLKIGGKDVGERLFVQTTTHDKEERRQQVRKKYDVVLLIGDQLTDLSSTFDPTVKDKASGEEQQNVIQRRLTRVGENRAHFGHDWIILPNPTYGDWVGPLGDEPAKHLHATKFDPAAK